MSKSKKARQPRGAPKGNQNARTHGFYSRVLTEAEAMDLQCAMGLEGIDMEIGVLRVKIKAVLENDPDNVRLIMDATNTLARLLRTKYNLDKTQGKSLKEAIGQVMKDLAMPIGIGVGVALK